MRRGLTCSRWEPDHIELLLADELTSSWFSRKKVIILRIYVLIEHVEYARLLKSGLCIYHTAKRHRGSAGPSKKWLDELALT